MSRKLTAHEIEKAADLDLPAPTPKQFARLVLSLLSEGVTA